MILITSQSPVAFAGACQDEDRDGYYHPSSPSYCSESFYRDCDDTDPNIYPGMGSTCSFPHREAIETIEDEVNDLIVSGNFDINSKQAINLLNRLQMAADQVDADKINVAINQLNSFNNNINSYINNGSISESDGNALIAQVEAIMATLQN